MQQSQDRTAEEKSLQSHILDKLVTDPETSPAEAVQQIVTITSSLSTPTQDKQLGNHCWHLAVALLEVAASTAPAQQSKLVSFLNQLRSTNVTTPSGEPLKYDNEAVWKDLPTFGYTIADELGSFILTRKYTPQEVQRWENTIAFIAQFDASVSASEPDLDFTTTWALMFLHLAFVEHSMTKSRELAIRLACICYIYDAEKIWKNVPDAQGFSLDNWRLWKSKLVEARSKCVEHDTAKKMMDDALMQIKRVETS